MSEPIDLVGNELSGDYHKDVTQLLDRIQELEQRPTITDEQINLIESTLDVSGSLFHGPTRKAWEAIRAALQENKGAKWTLKR